MITAARYVKSTPFSVLTKADGSRFWHLFASYTEEITSKWGSIEWNQVFHKTAKQITKGIDRNLKSQVDKVLSILLKISLFDEVYKVWLCDIFKKLEKGDFYDRSLPFSMKVGELAARFLFQGDPVSDTLLRLGSIPQFEPIYRFFEAKGISRYGVRSKDHVDQFLREAPFQALLELVQFLPFLPLNDVSLLINRKNLTENELKQLFKWIEFSHFQVYILLIVKDLSEVLKSLLPSSKTLKKEEETQLFSHSIAFNSWRCLQFLREGRGLFFKEMFHQVVSLRAFSVYPFMWDRKDKLIDLKKTSYTYRIHHTPFSREVDSVALSLMRCSGFQKEEGDDLREYGFVGEVQGTREMRRRTKLAAESRPEALSFRYLRRHRKVNMTTYSTLLAKCLSHVWNFSGSVCHPETGEKIFLDGFHECFTSTYWILTLEAYLRVYGIDPIIQNTLNVFRQCVIHEAVERGEWQSLKATIIKKPTIPIMVASGHLWHSWQTLFVLDKLVIGNRGDTCYGNSGVRVYNHVDWTLLQETHVEKTASRTLYKKGSHVSEIDLRRDLKLSNETYYPMSSSLYGHCTNASYEAALKFILAYFKNPHDINQGLKDTHELYKRLTSFERLFVLEQLIQEVTYYLESEDRTQLMNIFYFQLLAAIAFKLDAHPKKLAFHLPTTEDLLDSIEFLMDRLREA